MENTTSMLVTRWRTASKQRQKVTLNQCKHVHRKTERNVLSVLILAILPSRLSSSMLPTLCFQLPIFRFFPFLLLCWNVTVFFPEQLSLFPLLSTPWVHSRWTKAAHGYKTARKIKIYGWNTINFQKESQAKKIDSYRGGHENILWVC